MYPLKQRTTFLYPLLIICVLAISTFYSQQSPGGEGLNIPYNNWTWIFAVFVICAGCFQVLISKTIILPRYWLGMAALPIGLLISGFIVETTAPTQWLFRIGFVLGGFLFFLSLFQFQLKRRQIENILYAVCAAASLHSFIAFTQVSGFYFTSLIPQTLSNAPISIFQQVNVHASYLVTSFFIAIYLASQPSINKRPKWQIAILASCFFSTSTMLLVIGSRTTLVVFSISLPILLIAKYSVLTKTPKLALILLLSFIAGLFSGAHLSEGFERYETKLQKTTGHARVYIYDLSLQIIKEKPLLGHGLGSFETVFQEAKTSYPDAQLLGSQRYSHPHNELFYWSIESGLVSLIGIFIAFFTTLYAMGKLGWRKAFCYAALLLPISFHTQVELPFYHSAALWFLWLTFIFCCHSHNKQKHQVKLSFAGTAFVNVATLSIGSLIIAFFLHSMISLFGIVDFIRTSKANFTRLEAGRHNLYFQEVSENIFTTTLFYHSISIGDKKYPHEYIRWATNHLTKTPDTSTFNNLALAYAYIGQREKAIEIAKRAYSIYPATPAIAQRLKELQAGIPISQFKQKIKTLESRKQDRAKAENTNTESQAQPFQGSE